jgi:hypothetical protein
VRRRVFHWLGYTVVFGGVVPACFAYGFSWLRHQSGTSIDDVYGNGEILLIALAWVGAGLAELRDTPEKRKAYKEFLQWASLLTILLASIAYGFIKGIGNASPHYVALCALALLSLCGVVSTTAVAVGTE